MRNKLKSIFKRGKALIAAAAIAVTSAMTAVVACADEAATGSSSDITSMLSDAGDQITSTFTDLVGTIIPVIIGILGTGLVIFGIFTLVKLAKKIFSKVAG